MKQSKITIVILFSFFFLNLSQSICEEDCHIYPISILAGNFTLPAIQSVPPINDSMSNECIIGYKLIDSIAKNMPDSTIQDLQNNMSLDSLLVALRYRYNVQDYSPPLIRSFMRYSENLVENNYYQSYIASNYYNLAFNVQRRIEQIGYANSLLYLSDYILRIHVNCVENIIDSSLGVPYPWTNVKADVISRLKGENLPDICNDTQQCLIFGFTTEMMTNNGYKEFSTLKGGGDHLQQMVKDKEYIVFLQEYAFDDSNDYLTPLTQIGKNGGIFEITDDNKVIDKDSLFGLGSKPDIDDFISKINKQISEIKSKKYAETYCPDDKISDPNEISLTAFPNPNNSIINISFKNEKPAPFSIVLRDIQGKLVKILTHEFHDAGEYKSSFVISDLAQGSYLLSVIIEDKSYTISVIVQK